MKGRLPDLLYRVPAHLRLPVAEDLLELLLPLLRGRLLLLARSCVLRLPVVVHRICVWVDVDGVRVGHGLWFLLSLILGAAINHVQVNRVPSLVLIGEFRVHSWVEVRGERG